MHGSHGFFILFFALFMSFIDVIAILRVRPSRLLNHLSSRNRLSSLWPRQKIAPNGPEYAGLVSQELDDFDDRWVRGHKSSRSSSSERTLFNKPDSPDPDTTKIHRIGQAVFATLERALVFSGFGQLLTGVVVYTGGCRLYFINGCLAHLISVSADLFQI